MVPLEPLGDMEGSGTAFRAGSGSSWLRVAADWPAYAGHWVRLSYAQGFYDPCVRPLLRLQVGDAVQDMLLPAPVTGRGLWIGRIPPGTTAASIAPAMEGGPVNFRVDGLERISPQSLLARGLRRNPKHVAYAAALFVLGKRSRAERRLSRAATEAPVSSYPDWRREHERAFDPALDIPSHRGLQRRSFVLRLDSAALGQAGLEATIRSLAAQSVEDWVLEVSGLDAADEATRDLVRSFSAMEPRLREAGGRTQAGDEIVAELACGDTLRPEALAVISDAFRADSIPDAVYSDAEIAGGQRPLLLSDWSPLAGACGHMPRPLFRLAGDQSHPKLVRHIRRILASLGQVPLKPAYETASPSARPMVSVVVPTRDRMDLMRVVLKGVLEETDYPELELIILDNDSREAATLEWFRTLGNDQRIRIIHYPGAFNFSAICNRGALAARGEILLFLNNDIEVRHKDWLRHMVDLAGREDVGAVGAMLHYPDGRIQHAGVALGPADSAGHVYALHPADEPGINGELRVVREVSAVTAACLAVSKTKFEAIGGFDAKSFAITLNDIDLCLRLREQGWRCMFTPHAALTHHESASRPRNRIYEGELAAFRARWPDVIRDDPAFHPAFSLASLTPMIA